MPGHLHLIKLCVGIDSVESLVAWRALHNPKGAETRSQHVTRMWPKRAEELLDGGSLYWVIKGQIQARQRITALEEAIGQDGIKRCAIVMDPEIIRTSNARRRAFQGWRYLKAEDAPPDLPKGHASEDTLPPELSSALAEIGVL
ncbi:hypothetical protein AIOL_000175 [Candidatus Rhodobacter oscarellae]|uniref:Lysophospholipase n=1 Tax=Candidatus Rhodobacter oscarellae TaxID=1675527 RepID=A0A0J9EB66_9RHOB|nr:DUF1489 domain-containing protein [Candidatus Rhodobacter lobularis]KMW60025.1 hypothetical protein AIOL_000175 [Candidatus Rhodobacter lobularis]